MENEALSALIQKFYIYYSSWLRCQLKHTEDQSCSLSIAQFKVMMMLKNLKICSMSALSKEMELSKATMTTNLNKLVEDGLVQRKTSQRDRRTIFVELTLTGQERVEKFELALNQSFANMLFQLDNKTKNEIHDAMIALNKIIQDQRRQGCD